MRLRPFLFPLLFVFVGFSQAAADSWVQIGPLARLSQTAIMDPDDPSSIFAGYLYFDARLYHSSDGGNGWSLLSPPNYAIVFAPSNHDVAYAYGGYYPGYSVQRSADRGITWTQQSSFRTGPLAVDPNDENHLYAGSSDAMGFPQFCASNDGGVTWTCKTPDGWVGGWPRSIAIDPRDGNTAYVAMAGDFDNPGSGIYKTVNGGATWANVSQASSFYAEVACLAISPSNPDILFAGTVYGGFSAMGVFKSINAGATWAPSNAGIPNYTEVYDLAIDPLRPDTVYAAAGVLYRSVDEGAHWTGMPNAPSCGGIDLLASNPDVICLNTGTGVHLSQDAGAHFTQLGAPPVDMVSVLVDHSNSNVLYAAGDKLWRSTDRGAHWSTLDEFLPKCLAQDPNNRLVLYYGSFVFGPTIPNSSIWKSSTVAPSFRPVLRDVAVNDIEVARTNSSVVYAGGYQRIDLGGIFRSVDAGAHWTTVSSLQTNALAIDPTNASVVYIAGDAGMYKTIDGGATWLPITNGLNQPSSGRVLEVEIDRMHPQTLYASTSAQGLFKSNDGGATWAQLPGPLSNCQGIAIDPTDSQIVYASSWNGAAYVTVDGGEHWQQLGTATVGGESLVLDPTNRNVLYSALDGIWRYERTSQCATPVIASHQPDVVDLSQCDTGCALTLGVHTADDYSQVAVVALEHMVGNTWIQVDQITAPFPAPEWQLEYHVAGSEAPGPHMFRCVARGVDGSRAASAAVEVTFSAGPVPTFFSSIESAYVDGSVRIRWSTDSTADAQGFNVYRKKTGSELRRLNQQLIAAGGDQELMDRDVEARATYTYQVEAVAESGQWLSPTTSVSIPAFALRLDQNRPNPFNPSTTISFEMPVAFTVRLEIYDVNGHLVATVLNRTVRAGRNDAKWDGRDFGGRPASSGVYFYRLTTLGQVLTKRMVLLK